MAITDEACRRLSVTSPMGNKRLRTGIALGGVADWNSADLGALCTGCCIGGPFYGVELQVFSSRKVDGLVKRQKRTFYEVVKVGL